MKTIGTGNLTTLTDADLRTYIGALALDVYEAVIMQLEDFDLSFALGTVGRYQAELDRRIAEREDRVRRIG
jgi:hypothetical protein